MPHRSIERDTPIQYMKGVGPKRAAALAERYGLITVRDLLYHFPIRYEYLETITPLDKVKAGETVAIRGTIEDVEIFSSGKQRFKKRLEMLISDSHSEITLVWFNIPYGLTRRFELHDTVIAIGKAERFGRDYRIAHPKLFIDNPDTHTLDTIRPLRPNWSAAPLHHSRIVPVHRLTQTISGNLMRELVYTALLRTVDMEPDILPKKLRDELALMPIADALCAIHFPENKVMLGKARRRLIFEELFLFSMGFALRRKREGLLAPAKPVHVTEKIDERIRRRLPFRLTPSQDAVIRAINLDINSTTPMNRLLQGDVGTGKTIVSVYAAMATVAAGSQVAVMAPTEVLAAQLFHTFEDILKHSKVRIGRLTGSTPAAERHELIDAINTGQMDIVVGTHALLSDKIDFPDLRLVIIDEQQKFGVMQRSGLRQKGFRPHTLVMTATPIPRTLALAMYGDLTVSRLDNPPAGRGAIITKIIPPDKRADAFRFARKQIDAGRQVFVVVFAVNENDRLKSIESEFERLKDQEFAGINVAALYGSMDADEQARIMAEFRLGMIHVLLATSIVEVGIDVPNASVMIIEDADNFGLMTLHQLRGRVGRAEHKSYCFLMEKQDVTEDGRARMEVIARTRDGMEIAREDFALRGPGEFFGTEQSGKMKMRIANLFDDEIALAEAVAAADRTVRKDPELKTEHHGLLRKRLIEIFGDNLKLSDLSGIG